MLRITANGEEVESSQGARVAIEYAPRAINFILAWSRVIKDDQPKKVSRRIGHFTIEKIYSDHVVIGCHKITIEEVKKLQKRLEAIAV